MTSIRWFLALVLIAVITLTNFIAALHGYQTSMQKAESLFDDQLVNMASLLSHSLATRVDVSEKSDMAIQVWDTQNVLIQRSGNMPETPLTGFSEGLSHVSYEGYRWRTFTHFDEATAHWVIVAERIDMRFVLAEEVILSAVLPIILSLPLIGFLIWIILGRGLNPLAQLAALLREKKPQDLSPIEQNNNPKELAQLVNSTNELLARLGGSLDREKRFSGDAAHELRTPLSALKVHAFNLSKQLPANDESINMLNLSIDRMAHLIEQMLILYRTTPDQFVARFEQLDLEQLVQSVVISMYPRLEAKQQSISLESEQCFILADRFAIETLVSNILDNSNKYTGEGGEVKMFIQTDSENAILVVEDSGVGISPSLYGRVLERFYRVNGDQHDSDVIGCGLGFSIIQHIIELHSGAITLAHSSFDTGLKVTVLIPKEKR